MGLEDRDYMRERRRREFARGGPFDRPPRRSFLLPLLFWLALAAAGFKFADHWYTPRTARATQPPASLQASQVPAEHTTEEDPDDFAAHSTQPPRQIAPPQAHTAPAPSQPEPATARTVTTGGTIYHCKDYSGGTFWAQAHCAQHRALIDRIASVPAGIPFEQQVQIAEQHRQLAMSRALQAQRTYAPAPDPVATNKAACGSLDARVEQLDAMARQPQGASTQDWIRSERQKARDAQFRLRC